MLQEINWWTMKTIVNKSLINLSLFEKKFFIKVYLFLNRFHPIKLNIKTEMANSVNTFKISGRVFLTLRNARLNSLPSLKLITIKTRKTLVNRWQKSASTDLTIKYWIISTEVTFFFNIIINSLGNLFFLGFLNSQL